MTFLIPLFITFGAVLWLMHYSTNDPGTFGSGALYNIFLLLVAVAVTLAAWLGWFIVGEIW
jgi:hypothetical protein